MAIRAQGFDTGKPDPMLVYVSAGRRDFKIEEPGVINYDKGLPVKKALDPDTILAWAHNGEMLQHVHGAPVRLVVPGWSGNWWVKWLEKLEVMNRMPDCYYAEDPRCCRRRWREREGNRAQSRARIRARGTQACARDGRRRRGAALRRRI